MRRHGPIDPAKRRDRIVRQLLEGFKPCTGPKISAKCAEVAQLLII
jgi:hypothetical protein